MIRIIGILLLLASSSFAASPYFNTKVNGATTSGGGGGTTSPGGTVTGANQFRTAGGTFGGDDLIIDDGLGSLTLQGTLSAVSATIGAMPVSSTSAPLIVKQRTLGNSNGLIVESPSGGTNLIKLGCTNITSCDVAYGTGSGFIRLNNAGAGVNGYVATTAFRFGVTAGGGEFIGTVSGTLIKPSQGNASSTCGTTERGGMIYSAVKNTIAVCDGSASWIPLVSTTLISASGL